MFCLTGWLVLPTPEFTDLTVRTPAGSQGHRRSRDPLSRATRTGAAPSRTGRRPRLCGHRDVTGQPLTQSASLGAGHGAHRLSWSSSCSLLTQNTHRVTVTYDRKWGQWGREPRGGQWGLCVFPGPILSLIPLEPVGWRLLTSFPLSSCFQSANISVPGLRQAKLLIAVCRTQSRTQNTRATGQAGTQDRGLSPTGVCSAAGGKARASGGPGAPGRAPSAGPWAVGGLPLMATDGLTGGL